MSLAWDGVLLGIYRPLANIAFATRFTFSAALGLNFPFASICVALAFAFTA
jgi:hypothetical protein